MAARPDAIGHIWHWALLSSQSAFMETLDNKSPLRGDHHPLHPLSGLYHQLWAPSNLPLHSIFSLSAHVTSWTSCILHLVFTYTLLISVRSVFISLLHMQNYKTRSATFTITITIHGPDCYENKVIDTKQTTLTTATVKGPCSHSVKN